MVMEPTPGMVAEPKVALMSRSALKSPAMAGVMMAPLLVTAARPVVVMEVTLSAVM
jgi:hypothetical protein